MKTRQNQHNAGECPVDETGNDRGCEVDDDVGERFKMFRFFMGRTLTDFAAEMGVPCSILERIEKGDMEAVFTYGGKFLGRYGLNLNWLLCGTQSMFIND